MHHRQRDEAHGFQLLQEVAHVGRVDGVRSDYFKIEGIVSEDMNVILTRVTTNEKLRENCSKWG